MPRLGHFRTLNITASKRKRTKEQVLVRAGRLQLEDDHNNISNRSSCLSLRIHPQRHSCC